MRKRLLTTAVAALAVAAVSTATVVNANAGATPGITPGPTTSDLSFAAGSRADLGTTGALTGESDCYLDVTFTLTAPSTATRSRDVRVV